MVCVSDLLRKNPSFKHVKEVPIKKQVWIKKERKVEEVKMLSEVKDPLLDLSNLQLQVSVSWFLCFGGALFRESPGGSIYSRF